MYPIFWEREHMCEAFEQEHDLFEERKENEHLGNIKRTKLADQYNFRNINILSPLILKFGEIALGQAPSKI